MSKFNSKKITYVIYIYKIQKTIKYLQYYKTNNFLANIRIPC